MQPSWSEGGTARHNFGRGPFNDYFIKVWFQLSNWFQTRRFLCEFPIGSYVKLSSAVGAILVEGPNCLTYFWKRTIQWLFHQNLVLIEQMVSDKKFLWQFPIWSCVKLSSAVAAIMVGGLKCRTQFLKEITQESFQQSLVEIGSVISEEKIFFKFHPPFFLICIIGQNRQKFKVHKKSCNILYVKKLIIMLIQFKFGHILA